MIIEVKSVESAHAVTVNFPAQQLLASYPSGVKQIEVKMGLATISVSTEMLASNIGASASNVQLSVSEVDPSEISVEAKKEIGNNSVYDFNLYVDGAKISTFSGERPIKVSLPYNLQPGQDSEKVIIYYINDLGKLQTVKNGTYNPSNGMVEFYPKHFSKYTAAIASATFQDLSSVPWAKSGIEGLAVREVVNGVGDGRFSPNGNVTRAQFIQMLVGALEVEDDKAIATFADVSAGAWYYKAIATAQTLGIVNGREDGSFGINDPISRQDMAVMMYRAMKAINIVLPNQEAAAAFQDQETIASYATDAVATMQQEGIINGLDKGMFAPEEHATRALAAVMVYRLFKLR